MLKIETVKCLYCFVIHKRKLYCVHRLQHIHLIVNDMKNILCVCVYSYCMSYYLLSQGTSSTLFEYSNVGTFHFKYSPSIIGTRVCHQLLT
jgi:hypothetical protein